VSRLSPSIARLAPLLLLVAIPLVVAACVPGLTGPAGGSPTPTPIPSQAPLQPAQPGANPVELLAWLFTPIFQVLFIILVFFNQLTGNIVFAIILLTIVIRVAVVPPYRRQLVQSRQMQLLQPEVRELQRKYKGDRMKSQAAVQEFYRQRGVNPASGCLPLLLQFALLIPMYSVISQGLTNYDPSAMWHVFGVNLFPGITCPTAPEFDAAGYVTNACLQPYAFGINWGIPEPATTGLAIAGFGISILAIFAALIQLVASRMMLPPHDPRTADDQNVKVQRQMAYILPFISIAYGGMLPAGLFVYWIAATFIQIIQQYLILGWGGMFPLVGWYPEFARNHTPRFPVPHPTAKPRPNPDDPTARPVEPTRTSAPDDTIRRRGRSSRRGRRS
jgi:YidC/Oxa1 family membrane protein insertase